jgi:prepilin-type N-terminal cleavage/methylation domain-containing protein
MKSRRGVTLAEIMVALALVSIMITMVVSFTMLITERTQANAQNDAMRRDCELIRTGAERWLDAVELAGVTITSPADEPVGTMTAGESTLEFRYGALQGVLPDGESFTMRTENVKSVEFKHMVNDTDHLLFCTVTFDDPEGGADVEFTICVNSRLGEEGGAS